MATISRGAAGGSALACLLLACNASNATSPTELDSIYFLAGAWCGGENGERLEETWLAPVDGESIGMSRSLKSGQVTAFEFMRIARVNGVLTYLAQPGGRPATAFPLVASGIDWIAFENKGHDFPQRIEYSSNRGSLLAVISGPGKDGRTVEIAYRYQPCDSGRPPVRIDPIPG